MSVYTSNLKKRRHDKAAMENGRGFKSDSHRYDPGTQLLPRLVDTAPAGIGLLRKLKLTDLLTHEFSIPRQYSVRAIAAPTRAHEQCTS